MQPKYRWLWYWIGKASVGLGTAMLLFSCGKTNTISGPVLAVGLTLVIGGAIAAKVMEDLDEL